MKAETCAIQRLRLPPERIHFLKFILEGYDNLAIQSTIDRHQGVVELRYAPDCAGELHELLNALGPMLTIQAPVLYEEQGDKGNVMREATHENDA